MGEAEDREELIALMHANRIAIWTKNYPAWADCFVHEPYMVRWGYLRGGGIFARRGWEDISHRAKSYIEGDMPYDEAYAYQTSIENLILRIHGDMAWAIYDQQHPGHDYPDHVGPGLTREMRIFERYHGRWRIAVLAFLSNDASPSGTAMLLLDSDGKVLWTSAGAAQRMQDDDDLIIRNGRLQVRNSACNRKLQGALRWAADRDKAFTAERGSVPIVLGAGEGLPTRVWWVVADAGAIYFLLDGQPMTDKRLDVAAAIYGLSAGQRRLAGFIADGFTLPDAAREMGISANTARTHLQRIYDKTGVHNQPALVRVLLSVGVDM
jgi:DNA-binding CsgD family transcriptional regulator